MSTGDQDSDKKEAEWTALDRALIDDVEALMAA